MQQEGYLEVVKVCNYEYYQIEEVKEKAPTIILEERKNKFKDEIKIYIDEVPKAIIKEFYSYWTEPTKSGTKMRFELEKTWDLKRRLRTWLKNTSQWTNKPIGLIKHQENKQPKMYRTDSGINKINNIINK